MSNARVKNEAQSKHEVHAIPLFGEEKERESNGSRISFDLLPQDLAETIFDELNEEVNWQKMHHQTGEVPRLVCCQGTIGKDGNMPVYRHPSDQTLPTQSWTPAVDKVRKAAEHVVGHQLNHALIQLYRGGTDFISEHSDKTLDIVKNSSIVNVSFGAQRTMRLRTKRAAATSPSSSDAAAMNRTTYRVPMPHNSMIIMSLPTNAEYLHGINADKRPQVELTEAEKAFSGQRISLTFRHIGTFLNADSTRVWGQGAVGKTKDEANTVINADAAESERLVRAFGLENQSSKIVWDAIYGDGFDVLHLK
jgi:alkylated DNA repair dioxygenase AlkB